VVASTILTTHNHSQCLRRTSLVSSAMMRTWRNSLPSAAS
jgi:hypothetical protein